MLQRLLKSRKPEDLEQANALIKSFVKKVCRCFFCDLFRIEMKFDSNRTKKKSRNYQIVQVN